MNRSTQVSEQKRRGYLRAMGIDVWVDREPSISGSSAQVAAVATAAPTIGTQAPPVTLEQLKEQVASCRACVLHETRTQTVFGVGDPQADWLFIGEAPGADEDLQGEPFVGRAGQLLNAMLKALGLAREQVFIANVLKCRPPGNRDPRPEEVIACESFLQQQIRLIQPKVIVALGRHAAHNLLKTDQALASLRGRVHSYENTPLVITYHPAYLLRTPSDKGKAWADLCLARNQAGDP